MRFKYQGYAFMCNVPARSRPWLVLPTRSVVGLQSKAENTYKVDEDLGMSERTSS